MLLDKTIFRVGIIFIVTVLTFFSANSVPSNVLMSFKFKMFLECSTTDIHNFQF